MADRPDSVEGGLRSPAEPRRSELDALRAFVMLLGVVLHSSLAFFPAFWPVKDVNAQLEGPWDELFWAIHGFRMPAFFLLSGFFTSMLWRRRGLRALLWHRLWRVALPLAIGMVTIVPAVNWIIERASEENIERAVEEGDIVTMVHAGDAAATALILDNPDHGVGVEHTESPGGWSLLHHAAYKGHAKIAALLLERGADPGVAAFASRGETPFDLAYHFGREEVADLLVAHGAKKPLSEGVLWSDLPGWGEGAAKSSKLLTWLDQFHHLWFLWTLLWILGGFALVVFVVEQVRGRREINEAIAWPRWVMWLLIPLTVLPQSGMAAGGAYPMFGPDTVTGLLPELHVLLYYALFFTFGVLLFGRKNRHGTLLADTLGKPWWLLVPVSMMIVLPVGLVLTFVPEAHSRLWSQGLQVLYAWGMCIGLIGLFRALFSRERRTVRYLSDASYWIYIVHLPLVIGAQVIVRDWELPSGTKFLLISVGVTVLMLLIYQVGVRYTPIGILLNERKSRPSSCQTKAAAD